MRTFESVFFACALAKDASTTEEESKDRAKAYFTARMEDLRRFKTVVQNGVNVRTRLTASEIRETRNCKVAAAAAAKAAAAAAAASVAAAAATTAPAATTAAAAATNVQAAA